MPPRKPRASAASSAASTPRPTRPARAPATAQPSTPSRAPGASGARSRAAPGKTSPYFGRGKARGAAKADGSDGEDGPTGLTESDESGSSSDSGDSADAFAPSDEDEADEEVASELDSEDLDGDDDDDDDGSDGKPARGKRKSLGSAKGAAARGPRAAKRAKPAADEEDEDADDVELEEGQVVAGRIYPAPKTGQVPPGQISRNTFDFLGNLQVPERNDRDWFKSHEPSFRQAEKEWKDFVGRVQTRFAEADPEVPILPPKDVIHRIYRDVRFSSDKTPYKKSFSFSTSRSGRKGIWAGYYLAVAPGHSVVAGGVWMPGKQELAHLRHRFATEPDRFRREIEKPAFVRLFGPARPHAKGKRQNVFGHDDALKVAPKGVDKGHKDIDLLKLRSVAVVHQLSDEQVLDPNFMETVKDIVAVMAPFVHLVNDFMALPNANGGAGADDDQADEGGDEEEADQEDASGAE